MDSVDFHQYERRARRSYEWARARRAIVGFAPVLLVVALAALANHHAMSAVTFGSALFVVGVGLLWYGREARRAVLPGLAMGFLPLALALCANHMGHACLGGRCMMLCVPACSLGGLGAGIGVSLIAVRGQRGLSFWLGATVLALLTGAMGCTCVGYSGVLGLVVGYGLGGAPLLARKMWRRS